MACLKRKLTISVHDSRWEQKNAVARGAATLLALQLSGQVGEDNHYRVKSGWFVLYPMAKCTGSSAQLRGSFAQFSIALISSDGFKLDYLRARRGLWVHNKREAMLFSLAPLF